MQVLLRVAFFLMEGLRLKIEEFIEDILKR